MSAYVEVVVCAEVLFGDPEYARIAQDSAGMDQGREIVERYEPATRTHHYRQYLPANTARLHELATGIRQEEIR